MNWNNIAPADAVERVAAAAHNAELTRYLDRRYGAGTPDENDEVEHLKDAAEALRVHADSLKALAERGDVCTAWRELRALRGTADFYLGERGVL